MVRTQLVITFAVAIIALQTMVMADEKAADKNELSDELNKLGLGGGTGDLTDVVQRSVNSAMARQQAGGAQNLVPDPPVSANSYSDDWDDDDEPDYLAIRNQKDFYPRKGDAKRVNSKTFDEEVFNGEQEFTLVSFYSKWCKKCSMQAASYRAAAKRYKNDPKVKILVVNQEGNYDLSARFDTDPADPAIFFAHKNPQIDGDLKHYDGEVSFAGLLQFIGSRGKDMIKVEKYQRKLYYADGPVRIDVDESNFNQTVFNPKKNVMVAFYADWSEFCQIDAGNYTVLAGRMKLSNPDDVEVVAIDVDKHEHLADRFDVEGLPAYWFANKTVTEDTQLVKYTGDHNGALVIEELYPYINSQGMKIPYGMEHDWPIHPKPWPVIEKAMKERDAKEKEKDDTEKKEQEERAVERREKHAAKKKALEEKKAAKKKQKDDL